MSKENIQLRKEFQTKKKEVSRLRSKLNELNSDKEAAYREIKSVRDKVKVRSTRMRELKHDRDQLTKEVKKLKVERDKLNKEVKAKSSTRKEVEGKKKELLDKSDIQENPAKIKSQINHLEQKLETEVMAFSKEEQLRKTIKELKVKYKKAEKMGEVWKEINTASADFAEKRRRAQDSHKEVQEKAQESQEKHEKLKVIFDELKKLRDEEQPLAEKHLQFKVKFEQVKKDLEESLKRVNELAKLFNEQEEKSFKAKVKEKTAEVKEKMKKGKKLSTEDILAFQALKE